MERINTYEKWLEQEGLPVIREYGVPDLMEVPLKPWARKGGSGAYINLIGGEENLNAYLCEIPPGGTLLPQRHLYEETIYIMSGCGATTVWVDGGVKQTFEWQEGSLFSPPLNTWHQHFNGQSDKPVRYVGVTRMPVFMNLFHDLDFIFNNNFIFKKRYSGEEGYFSSQGKQFDDTVFGDPKVAETNFVPDCRSYGLADEKAGGMGEISFAFFEMSNNIMTVHISQQRAGTYKTAHHHGPGAHLVCLSGQGYTLMWPAAGGIFAQGVERVKVDWRKNGVFSPPDKWFHQHFVTGTEPAKLLAFHAERSRKYKGVRGDTPGAGRRSIKLGGTQINYEDEDPEIRRLFKEELKKTGGTWQMSKYFPNE